MTLLLGAHSRGRESVERGFNSYPAKKKKRVGEKASRMFTGNTAFLHLFCKEKLFYWKRSSLNYSICNDPGRSAEVLDAAFERAFQRGGASNSRSRNSLSRVFASHFLGYASMDGVSACSPLAAVEVAEAFHWFCLWKPHRVNVSLIYTFRSSHCRILCLVNVYINYEKSWYKWLYSFIHVACVAPNNNSVVMKLNKTSLGFFKRHPLAGVFHCPSTFWMPLVDNYANNLPRSKNNYGNS